MAGIGGKIEAAKEQVSVFLCTEWSGEGREKAGEADNGGTDRSKHNRKFIGFWMISENQVTCHAVEPLLVVDFFSHAFVIGTLYHHIPLYI